VGLSNIKTVLIANRGEIAVRVIRACHELGLKAVAVYSEVDADSLHVRLADEARLIGPAASAQSYLVADKLLAVAKETGCDAVHPGYGFLSENADFARAVIAAGLVFVGPSPEAIESMGTKTRAREIMQNAGVPVVPGTAEPVSDLAKAAALAQEIGFPIMVKAAAGGGGKGMRQVFAAEELEPALRMAASEAQKSFGDASVYLERLIGRPRHVEVQILGDGHGNIVHLFERDCSVQRRHQKVFEETPCPVLKDETRKAMCEVACQAGRAVDYVGAGTVEFLLDESGEFYFLEMNTRLQVEHPITEVLTGVDLVQAQLRIADGEPLWLKQEDIQRRGHAVECRIYAEDIHAGFRPAPGPLQVYREPQGPWTRVDSGVCEGGEVSIHYDPMIAKLIVWGATRDEALGRARRALLDYRIVGVESSIPFFLALFDDTGFKAGTYNTGLLTQEWLDEHCGRDQQTLLCAAKIAAVARFERASASSSPSPSTNQASSRWKSSGTWRPL
jgi:acetyl-CoA carboxylase biotin carboxylase subunit